MGGGYGREYTSKFAVIVERQGIPFTCYKKRGFPPQKWSLNKLVLLLSSIKRC